MDYETLRPRETLTGASAGDVHQADEVSPFDEPNEQDTYGNAWMQCQIEGSEQEPSGEEAVPERGPAAYEGPVYDLATVTDEQIEVLYQGSDEEQRTARTIEEARVTYGSLLEPGPDGQTPGRIVVTTSEGNGGQPVLVIVPPGYSADADTTVHTHYHGKDTTVGAEHSTVGRDQAILDAVRENPQTILVLPEDRGAPTSAEDDVSYSATWGNADDQVATTEDALRAVDLDPTSVDRSVVSAHSAGGAAIRNLARAGKLQADELLLHDCFYGNQGERLLDWLKELPEEERPLVSYYLGTNDAATQTRGYPEALGPAYKTEDGFGHNPSLTENFGSSLHSAEATDPSGPLRARP